MTNTVRPPARISAVIVLYKRRLVDSPTFKTLSGQVEANRILVYDNSPELVGEPLPQIQYFHNPNNGGLTAAYAWAQERAKLDGSTWLLLLDQDSEVPPGYISTFENAVSGFSTDVVAAIPNVVSSGRVVSPRGVFAGIPGVGDLPRAQWGTCRKELTAINSGCFVRLDYLDSIGGFVASNSVDGIDRFFFGRVFADRKHVFRLPIEMEHDISISDTASIPLARWESINSAEADFYLTKPKGTQALAALLLAARAASPRMRISAAARKATFRQAVRLIRAIVGGV